MIVTKNLCTLCSRSEESGREILFTSQMWMAWINEENNWFQRSSILYIFFLTFLRNYPLLSLEKVRPIMVAPKTLPKKLCLIEEAICSQLTLSLVILKKERLNKYKSLQVLFKATKAYSITTAIARIELPCFLLPESNF